MLGRVKKRDDKTVEVKPPADTLPEISAAISGRLIQRLEEIQQKDGEEARGLLNLLLGEFKAAERELSSDEAAGDITRSYRDLGEALVAEGVITAEQMREALGLQVKSGGYLGKIIVESGFIREDLLFSFIFKSLKVPLLQLKDYQISMELIELVSLDFCLERRVLPIDKLGRIVTLSMVDPFDQMTIEEVRNRLSNLRVKPVMCHWQEFDEQCAKLSGTPA